jgi:guanylate kinase
LIGKILQAFPGTFGFSVSHTTRAPRPGETNGVDYHFTSAADMGAAISRGEFLEHANVHGNLYGTSFKAVRDVAAQGQVCILDIDVQGCKSVKAVGGGTPELPQLPHFVFVAPPNIASLQQRLAARGTETAAKVATRVANAVGEVSYGLAEGNFDVVVVNDDLDTAYAELVGALAGLYPAVAAQLQGEGGDEGGEDEEESPAEFLERCGLGAYVQAFLKFGVESVSDVETSARLLSDEELQAELGMAPKDVALFREIFAFEDDEEGGAEEEEEEEEEEENNELEENDSDGSL